MSEASRKVHYHVAAGMIWKDGRVLITRRPKGSHMEGLWEFPGGKKEEGETLRECLEREIREELGVDVRAEEFLARVDHEYETRSISLHLFRCSPPEQVPVPLGCESILWVRPEELGQHSMPAADQRLLDWIADHPLS